MYPWCCSCCFGVVDYASDCSVDNEMDDFSVTSLGAAEELIGCQGWGDVIQWMLISS